ncbi:hypothetical protein E1263_42080 [Kribbella antibiotica]|uniref:Uncharacterized protein n=1 Tax=Kribbella antibiotica TaxID=190195 RepID=A0A4R4YDB6_9ACTN|nr:hypothetical protein E1263_42080 [Kribbella antibiotica]
MDVSIFACDVPVLRAHVGERWHLWNLAGGDMRPLTNKHPDVFGPASQVWVREHGDAPWVIDLPLTPDTNGLWTSKYFPEHTARLEDATWVAGDGVRYLRPELVLLFKARLHRSKDRHDFDRAWPLLSTAKQDWLRETVRRFYPDCSWKFV